MSDNSFLINRLNMQNETFSGQISANNEKLSRLKNALENIAADQQEFMSNKRYTRLPELTSSTWAGRHADSFLDTRQDVDNLYSKIGENEIEDVLREIEEKIQYFEGLNTSLSDDISYNRSRITQLEE